MIRVAASVLGLLAWAGALAALPPRAAANGAAIRALYTAQPVAIDGKLDDAIWAKAPGYPLVLPRDLGPGGHAPAAATAYFAWDHKYFYIAVRMADDDVKTTCEADGLLAYRFGDVLEVFLKPDEKPGYWELYATPNGHQTTFFWPSGGLRWTSSMAAANELVVAAQIQGTLNNSADVDRGWTAEMAVPLALLENKGAKFAAGSKWNVLIGRYNYSIHLPAPELTSLPSLSTGDFQRTAEYAPLTIEGESAR